MVSLDAAGLGFSFHSCIMYHLNKLFPGKTAMSAATLHLRTVTNDSILQSVPSINRNNGTSHSDTGYAHTCCPYPESNQFRMTGFNVETIRVKDYPPVTSTIPRRLPILLPVDISSRLLQFGRSVGVI
jgi:hypothetical protein